MNKKIASEIAIGIILVLVILIGGIFSLQSKKAQVPAPQQVAIQSPAAPIAQPEVANLNQNVYKNESFNFQVQLPENWIGTKQNEDKTLLDVYFYDQTVGQGADKSDNPLL